MHAPWRTDLKNRKPLPLQKRVSLLYFRKMKKTRKNFKKVYELKKLRTICSTGSPLSVDCFKYVYNNIKKNVHLASISGGTDIVSCFVLGNLYQSVHAGEIQSKGLGMDVRVFNEKGKSILNQKFSIMMEMYKFLIFGC